MITTVTTTTTTTVVMLQQAVMFAGLGVIVLLGSLVTKELLSPAEGKTRVGLLGRQLKMAILPLLFAFAVILAVKILEVLKIAI